MTTPTENPLLPFVRLQGRIVLDGGLATALEARGHDLNDDLWKAPFNKEYEDFVSSVRDLIVPVLEAVQRYGEKKRHLQKFRKDVDRFYKNTIDGRLYGSEIAIKYQKRFVRYRDSLFVFLEHDGIAWSNNMAERALRHFAVQRKISGSFGADRAREYLRFLGITQTCRFQGKSLLRFLLSGELDVDVYKERRRLRTSYRAVSRQNLRS